MCRNLFLDSRPAGLFPCSLFNLAKLAWAPTVYQATVGRGGKIKMQSSLTAYGSVLEEDRELWRKTSGKGLISSPVLASWLFLNKAHSAPSLSILICKMGLRKPTSQGCGASGTQKLLSKCQFPLPTVSIGQLRHWTPSLEKREMENVRMINSSVCLLGLLSVLGDRVFIETR